MSGKPQFRCHDVAEMSGTDDAEAAVLIQRCKSDLSTPVSNFFEDIDEEDTSALSPLSRQCQEIWQTVQLKSVWRPMVEPPYLSLILKLNVKFDIAYPLE